jgi:hypothetical protein
MQKFILAIDQSTSATKALIFNSNMQIVARENIVHAQYYPQPGWVEHDPEEIFKNTLETIEKAISEAKVAPAQISAMAITNQRETVVVWDKTNGKPVYNAIVWQCNRGAVRCNRLKAEGWEERIREKTGLVDCWDIIPMGGAELLSVFVTLLDPSLKVTVLVGSDGTADSQKDTLQSRFRCVQRVITFSEFLQREQAGIEDMFSVPEYLLLYNAAFSADVTPMEIRGNGSVYTRICAARSLPGYDRNRPAMVMMRSSAEFLQRLGATTIERFDQLFQRINASLEK